MSIVFYNIMDFSIARDYQLDSTLMICVESYRKIFRIYVCNLKNFQLVGFFDNKLNNFCLMKLRKESIEPIFAMIDFHDTFILYIMNKPWLVSRHWKFKPCL